MQDFCIVVSPSSVADFRAILQEHSLHDPSRRLHHLKDENQVAVPVCLNNDMNKRRLLSLLSSHPPVSELRGKCPFILKQMKLPKAKKLNIQKPEQVLKESLKKLLTERGISWIESFETEVPSSWERHGDLILVPSSAFRNSLWHQLGDSVWQRVVKILGGQRLAQKGVVSTDGFRTPQVTVLFGRDGWVQHVDNGVRYTYDITKCMFSAGNITEKLRVAKFDCKDEVVVDLYAGIGYFTLPYLLYTGVKHLHACEWNTHAVEALQRNLVLNNVVDRCTVHEGDNRKVCPKGVADRVNLGLIPSSRDGWETACSALKSKTGGILHIHYNVNTKAGDQSVTSLPVEVFRQEARIESCKKYELSIVDGFSHAKHYSSTNNESVTDNMYDINEEKVSVVSERGYSTGDLHLYKHTNTGGSKCFDVDFYPNVEGRTSYSDNKTLTYEQKNVYKNMLKTTVTETYHTQAIGDFICRSKQGPHKTHGCKLDPSFTDISTQDRPESALTKESCSKVKKDNSKWLSWAVTVAEEIEALLEQVHGGSWLTDILHIEHVKSYAPHVDHVVLDLKCKPSNTMDE